MNKIEFVRSVETARLELLKAYNLAYSEREYNRAGFVSNAINQLDALLHIERITKEVKA